MVRLILTAAALSALVACGSGPADGKEAEAQALIAALEKEVALPDATRLLAGYDRYYSVSEDRIEAVYLSSPSGSGGIHLVEGRKLPQAEAEGCSAVNLVFDRGSNSFQRILCNELRLTQAKLAPELAPEQAPQVELLPKAARTRGSRGERG